MTIPPSLSGPNSAEFLNAVGGSLHPGGLKQTAEAVERCRWPRSAALADVGCGTGATLSLLKSLGYHNIIGYDRDQPMATGAGAKSGAVTAPASTHHMPTENESYDVLICECVLSLTENAASALGEFHRVLKPMGKLILSDITTSGEAAEELKVVGLCAANTVSRLLAENGFNIIFQDDRSTGLKEMAAQLLWHGLSLCDFFPAQKKRPAARYEYWLWIAEKQPPSGE